MFTLAVALIINTVLGPVGTGAIDYPISGTLLNQVIGLEAVSVGLVVPMTIVAGVLSLRGHRAAAFLGLGPAAYSAYMLLQYVLGPEYSAYTTVALFHVAVFTLSGVVAVRASILGSRQPLPHLTVRRRRLYGVMLLLLAAFILSRYADAVTAGRLPPEFAEAHTFYWSIFLLDLGIVVPATVAVGIGLLRGSSVAQPALYAVILWYALVPPSVAAMSTTMVINGDPHASTGQAILLSVLAVGFGSLAAWVYWPLLRTPRGSPANTGA
ncbi:MAG TPA: hypothetical protein VFG63_08570 [Nocardioidaceae bacterium]|nr:hypothetical protein [Nocardioidaceae bacterium]